MPRCTRKVQGRTRVHQPDPPLLGTAYLLVCALDERILGDVAAPSRHITQTLQEVLGRRLHVAIRLERNGALRIGQRR